MLFYEVKHPAYNVLLFKLDDEIIYKVFLKTTSRFYYDITILIDDKRQDIFEIDFNGEYLIILLNNDEEDIKLDKTIEIFLSLKSKTKSFNRFINTRYNEINQIHELWEKNKDVFELKETTLTDENKCDIFKMHFEKSESNNTKAIVDNNCIPDIIDAEFSVSENKMIEMK